MSPVGAAAGDRRSTSGARPPQLEVKTVRGPQKRRSSRQTKRKRNVRAVRPTSPGRRPHRQRSLPAPSINTRTTTASTRSLNPSTTTASTRTPPQPQPMHHHRPTEVPSSTNPKQREPQPAPTRKRTTEPQQSSVSTTPTQREHRRPKDKANAKNIDEPDEAKSAPGKERSQRQEHR